MCKKLVYGMHQSPMQARWNYRKLICSIKGLIVWITLLSRTQCRRDLLENFHNILALYFIWRTGKTSYMWKMVPVFLCGSQGVLYSIMYTEILHDICILIAFVCSICFWLYWLVERWCFYKWMKKRFVWWVLTFKGIDVFCVSAVCIRGRQSFCSFLFSGLQFCVTVTQIHVLL